MYAENSDDMPVVARMQLESVLTLTLGRRILFVCFDCDFHLGTFF